MKVAGYVRVSTEKQRDEGSHETQREQLEEWASLHDHELELFEDIAISGQSDQREAYDDLMGSAEEFDAVAVRELSRFGRNLQRNLNDIETLKEIETDFITLQGEGKIDTSTAQGKLLFQIMGAFNEFWANQARERAIENVERRRKNGEPIGRPRKLNPEQIDQVKEWNDMGLGYSAIVPLVEDAYGVEIDRSTIYRYCTES